MIAYDKILQALESRVAVQLAFAQTATLYIDLISAQARVQINYHDYAAIAQVAHLRLQRGLSILPPEAFRADCNALVRLCDETCTITARHRPELNEPLAAICAWLNREHSSILALAADYLRDDVMPRADDAGLNSALLGFVLNNALHPFLRAYAKVASPFVDLDIWFRPRCPICNGRPDFAALAKETGTRILLCARCDFEWRFWRNTCPFCGCEEPLRIKYSTSDDQVYRLYTCEQCQGYIKTIDLRMVDDTRILPVERILTQMLDVAARQIESE
jgi:FdhE protein